MKTLKKLLSHKGSILFLIAIVACGTLGAANYVDELGKMTHTAYQSITPDTVSSYVANVKQASVNSVSSVGSWLADLVKSLDISSVFGTGVSMATPVVLVKLKDVDGKEFEVKSDEEIDKMGEEDQAKYLREVFSWYGKNMVRLEKEKSELSDEQKAEMEKQLTEMKESQFKILEKTLEAQGEAIEFLKGQSRELTRDEKSQIKNFIKENKDKIIDIKNAGSGTIEFTTKAPESITTGNATNPDGIPELFGQQNAPASNVNLREAIVEGLVTVFQTDQSVYAYSDSLPKEGDAAFVAEEGTKPQIDLVIQTRYAQPVKVAAYEVLSEESVQDIRGLQSIATDYLRKRHDLRRQDGILFGDGVAPNPEGSTVVGRTFVAGAMALQVTTPNFMDVVNACITDIYTTHNFADERPYMANLVLINPIDYFIELVSAKDNEGQPLFPTASLFNRVDIGGTTILPFYKIPAGKIHVADMSKYNVTNYIPYTVRIGWINDQFIKNQFTMVGESRMHAFVKFLDRQAFIYDDIATIRTAIAKP